MKCSKCNAELRKDAKFCSKCGEKVESSTKTTTEKAKAVVENKTDTTNTLSLVGFILSIVNIFCCGSLFTPAIVLCIIGLIQINKNGGKGKELSIIGIVLSAFMLLVAIAITIIRTAAGYTSYINY